jgi:hypothetical protein
MFDDTENKKDSGKALQSKFDLAGPIFDERTYLRDAATISPVSRTGHGAIFGEDCNVFLQSIER